MKSTATEKYWIASLILMLSLVCWGVLLNSSADYQQVSVCGVSSANFITKNFSNFPENRFFIQLYSWSIMVGAMMMPKLFAPICYLFERSLKKYRFRLITLFILGYLLVWLGPGVLLLGYMDWNSGTSEYNLNVQFFFLILAIIWQFSPLKQRLLNLGHKHKTIRAFGWNAHRDSFRFGLEHGLWCVGSGWALMLLPFVFPSFHYSFMAVVMLIMIGEHFEYPRVPKWKTRLGFKLIRILIQQLQLRKN